MDKSALHDSRSLVKTIGAILIQLSRLDLCSVTEPAVHDLSNNSALLLESFCVSSSDLRNLLNPPWMSLPLTTDSAELQTQSHDELAEPPIRQRKILSNLRIRVAHERNEWLPLIDTGARLNSGSTIGA